jgi:hypothetical protein
MVVITRFSIAGRLSARRWRECQKITKEAPAGTGASKCVVLPDRIELSTSPFITLILSHPPCGVCVLDHPFTVVPKDS